MIQDAIGLGPLLHHGFAMRQSSPIHPCSVPVVLSWKMYSSTRRATLFLTRLPLCSTTPQGTYFHFASANMAAGLAMVFSNITWPEGRGINVAAGLP